ncbi:MULTISPECIES: hypothetical protein [unclassified Mycoplasma]|uniref:hypothetical protein n=1 Tax=unclassified Mycoplasma TaxID=2683645 RepID=UPI001C12597D|nr:MULTISPECIES: hypothetical protein [unclassified Mycoplasma]MBU4693235.1 hypothetical protein [Mycoplasma sp. CSL7491-lung]MCU4707015.1 hypothetical protein [Mycoplasma sp. CSL7503-lung]
MNLEKIKELIDRDNRLRVYLENKSWSFKQKIIRLEKYILDRKFQLDKQMVEDILYRLVWKEMKKWNQTELYDSLNSKPNILIFFNKEQNEKINHYSKNYVVKKTKNNFLVLKDDLTISELENLLKEYVNKEPISILYYDDQNYPHFESYPYVLSYRADLDQSNQDNCVNFGELVFDNFDWN